MISLNRLGKLSTAAFVAASGLGAAASTAAANTTPLGSTAIAFTAGSQSTCVDPLIVTPYAALRDYRQYVLAPAGSFTGGVTPGWRLSGGATFAADAARGTSLSLPAGGSVISPAMCIDLNYPHLRLAYKMTGLNVKGVELRTEIVYPQLANPHWTEVSQFDAYQGEAVASGWRISKDIQLKPDFAGSSAGARYVALRFTAVKKERTSAQIRIDDVFIDPYRRS